MTDRKQWNTAVSIRVPVSDQCQEKLKALGLTKVLGVSSAHLSGCYGARYTDNVDKGALMKMSPAPISCQHLVFHAIVKDDNQDASHYVDSLSGFERSAIKPQQ